VDLLNKLLEKSPYSRLILVTVLALTLIALNLYFRESSNDRAIAGWESALQQRKQSVELSLLSLPIADPSLLVCIRRAAADRANIHPRNSGGIDDVRELQMLYCRREGISSLSGIEALSSLRFLDISDNGITSLQALRGHPALETLHAADNPIDSVSVLGSLPLLKEVILPDLPGEDCVRISGTLKGVRSNASKIACAGGVPGATNTDSTVQLAPRTKPKRNNKELSDSQHQEMLKYERETLYQKR